MDQIFYHRKWQGEDTEENFFKWLDHGGGKDLSLPECSREQLEKERIMEQRANYLVKIDEKLSHEVVLCDRGYFDGLETMSMSIQEVTDGKTQVGMAIYNTLLQATNTHIGNGLGIIPMTPEEMRGAELAETPSKHGKIGFLPSSSDSLSAGEEHYTETAAKPGDGKMMQEIRNRFTSKGVMERLLRKTVKNNTWIYVCDDLTKRGADLGKVQVTKAEITLWGLEHYKRFQKAKQAKQKTLTDTVKSAVSPKPKSERTQSNGGQTQTNSDSERYEREVARQEERDAAWADDNQWRRDILCGRRRKKKTTTRPRVEQDAGNDAEQSGGTQAIG
ncbi:hypothetical protein FRC09_015527 [Ceratobasidium sp. 395]|nr:hypothetical protein FRC09_015527 [Ceratobasidium sp. 395]